MSIDNPEHEEEFT